MNASPEASPVRWQECQGRFKHLTQFLIFLKNILLQTIFFYKTIFRMNITTKTLLFFFISLFIFTPDSLQAQNTGGKGYSLKSNFTYSAKSPATFIDGTYELTERIMADGTVLRPPTIKALYVLFRGRINFNLFMKKKDGTMSSESTIGHYTFTNNQYCEWIDYTIRSNLDSAGVTYNGPVVTNHCATVTWSKGGFSYSPPGESVDVIFREDGFTAKIAGEFVDYWKKLK